MNTELLQKCNADAFAGAITFGESIGRMLSTGVEWYSANLILGCTIHYASDGTHVQVRWPEGEILSIASCFDAGKVSEAIRAAQKGEIIYPEFIRRIAAAGVTYYTAHPHGRKVLYFGRHGDFHRELFPQT